jgi:hypothetical protein
MVFGVAPPSKGVWQVQQESVGNRCAPIRETMTAIDCAPHLAVRQNEHPLEQGDLVVRGDVFDVDVGARTLFLEALHVFDCTLERQQKPSGDA